MIVFRKRFDLIPVWMKREDNNSESGTSLVSLCNANGTSNNICDVEIELTSATFVDLFC